MLVELGGDIDVTNAEALRDELCAAIDRANKPVVVDMSAVSFLGDAGVRMMVAVHLHAEYTGTTVLWRHLQPLPARMLDIENVAGVLNIDH